MICYQPPGEVNRVGNSDISNAGESREENLPRRDWILLPLLSVLTVVVLAFSLNVLGARLFAKDLAIGECIVIDPTTGERGIPNRVCTKKTPEGPPVEYRFNGCGHRALMDCGPKTSDAYRIVMTGSSYAFGWAVPIQETFAALLPSELMQRTGHRVEFYNASMIGEGGVPRNVAIRFNEVLAAQPDAILWIVDPWGVDKADRSPRAWEEPRPASLIKQMLKQALVGKLSPDAIPAILASIQNQWATWNPGVILIKHYLFQSQSEYLKQYLVSKSQSGFLRAEPDSYWRYRLEKFSDYAAAIEEQAKAARVSLFVALVPNRAQAAMISVGEWPAGYNPYKLGEELRAIVIRNGGTYIDILPDFRAIPNPEQYYYPIDDHPNAAGNAILAGMLAREITNGAFPPPKAADQPRRP